jgi:RNA polymerase sigma-70 factor (ECF subfamily)
MSTPPPPRPGQTTTTLLLDSLKDVANAAVWEEFDARYRPILHGFARKLGLNDEDSADVAQQALTEFVRDYRAGRYERGKGRLSSWLISIARNKAIDVHRVSGRRREWRGESAFEPIPGSRPPLEVQDSASDAEHWESERRHAILALALTKLRENSRTAETTIKAFELVALRGVPTDAVARECGISVDEVYVAKNRVTKQLREIVAQITQVYDGD